MLENQNIKLLLQTAFFQIGLKKYLWLKKVKNTVLWTYFISGVNREKMFERFTKNNCKKQIKKSLELKKK